MELSNKTGRYLGKAGYPVTESAYNLEKKTMELTAADLELQKHIARLSAEWKPAQKRLMVSHSCVPVRNAVTGKWTVITVKQ
jgi:hypothetical protein